MQEQLTELQLKLAKEEEEKTNVTKLNQDLKQVIEYSYLTRTPSMSGILFYFYFPRLIHLLNYLKRPTNPRNNPLPCIIVRWVLNVNSMFPVIVIKIVPSWSDIRDLLILG